jgi:hypothetical protein
MPYVITQPCIGSKDACCVEVCPVVDCIHPTPGRGAQALFALKKEKYMNQIDQQDPCELLRTAGFTEAEIAYLGRLRRAYREKSSWLTPAEERRLAFVRWLVTTGRLTEQVAWSVLEEA